jgi:acetyl-CoA carboxylase biotin carboxyl carrier protein
MVNETDIVEFELKSKRFSLAVRKKEALEAAAAAAAPAPQVVYASGPAPAAAAPAPAAPAPAAAAAPPAPAAPAAPAPPAVVDGVEMASPMGGTFYRSPAPGEPAFSGPGDKVTKGQTICIIEAMKLMNEIEAETTGTLMSFTVENGSPVTTGQILAIIKP